MSGSITKSRKAEGKTQVHMRRRTLSDLIFMFIGPGSPATTVKTNAFEKLMSPQESKYYPKKPKETEGMNAVGKIMLRLVGMLEAEGAYVDTRTDQADITTHTFPAACASCGCADTSHFAPVAPHWCDLGGRFVRPFCTVCEGEEGFSVADYLYGRKCDDHRRSQEAGKTPSSGDIEKATEGRQTAIVHAAGAGAGAGVGAGAGEGAGEGEGERGGGAGSSIDHAMQGQAGGTRQLFHEDGDEGSDSSSSGNGDEEGAGGVVANMRQKRRKVADAGGMVVVTATQITPRNEEVIVADAMDDEGDE